MNAPRQLRDTAEAGKHFGMTLAADAKPDRVTAGKISLLQALFASPDGTATIDDATGDLAKEYQDGGKWRGSICHSLAVGRIIERVDVVKSDRPSRHRGYVTRWRLVDRRKASLLLAGLVAAMDARLTTAATLAAAQNETPAGTTAEVSVQKNFPGFEKGFSNGQIK